MLKKSCLYPHSDTKDNIANSIRWTILSVPSHSQKETTVGKYFPGNPISTIITEAQMSPGNSRSDSRFTVLNFQRSVVCISIYY